MLLGLTAALVGYLLYQRHRNYPVRSIVTPDHRKYDAAVLPDRCESQVCMTQVIYLTELDDTVKMHFESEGLLKWVEPKVRQDQNPQLVLIMALKPGLLRMAPPTRIVQLGYGRQPPAEWKYLGAEDVTNQFKALLK